MSKIKSSYYSRRDKVWAARDVVRRMREKWADDPVMMHLAGDLELHANRMAEGYGGVDTRLATADVQLAEERRDNATRSLYHHLKALQLSEAHRESWEAASKLFQVLGADGLSWIHDSYAAQSLKTHEILAKYQELSAEIEACRARVFVDQLQTAESFFEEKVVDRGAQLAERPELLAKVSPDFERALRATLIIVEGRPESADRTYVLEPFSSLTRKYGPASPAPEPPPQA